MVTPKDTDREAFARQMDALKKMDGQDRLRLALEMSDELRELTKAGIRARHPQYTDSEVLEELEVRLLGRELANAVRQARRQNLIVQ